MTRPVFRPKLFEALQGYNRQRLASDVGAGVTVSVVALPLAMAFGIASGLTPQTGLVAAIVGGFLISALGGSRVQIGGPAGAFVVIVYGMVQALGVQGLMLATLIITAMYVGMCYSIAEMAAALPQAQTGAAGCAAHAAATDACGVEGDLDGDGLVGGGDLSVMLLDYGPCVGCISDIDGNGRVDYGDIALTLLEVGPCP